MHCLRRAGLVFDLLPISIPPYRGRNICSLRPNFTRKWQVPRCAKFSSVSNPGDLFNYTSGRWIVNEALRLTERRREFNVNELGRLAAQSVGRSVEDVRTFVKLAEGGFNRIFLITMRDGFKMVARIPYPATAPKFYAVASEAATMRFLHSLGLPVPEVYGYSPSPDNAAETEYIFMEYMKGTVLSDIWDDLEEADLASVIRQITQLESQMMSIAFPAGGSLYYTDDLEKVAGRTAIPLKDERFSVGRDVKLRMWFGRRSQLDLDRGPYEGPTAFPVPEEIPVARCEIPLPFQRIRRECYEYKEQSPLDHIENLERYLLIASTFIPKNPALHPFCMRHPDLTPSNIIVSRSADSNELQIVSVLDWQHASILPLCFNAVIPGSMQNYDDPMSQLLVPPSQLVPTNLDELNEYEKGSTSTTANTEKYNKLHHDALTSPVSMVLGRLHDQACVPWEGETHGLKLSLIDATEWWERRTGGGVQCPVVFDPEDVRKTKELEEKLQEADELLETLHTSIGFGKAETWVPNNHYETAVRLGKELKENVLADIEEGDRDNVEEHWFLKDMDETDYK
ncbi:hypothetical protein H0H92_008132 [Tricholoma furcatifolium]|nr:hypothetical protein H0H92_008132 [Tricholoma furcatifolium]